MRKRHSNHRRVKIHRSYTVEEVAQLFGAHKNTVRAWIKAGLPTCDRKRPTLILGRELASFLQARRVSKKQPCQPGELYCVRCRAPKFPAGDMAEYQPINHCGASVQGPAANADTWGAVASQSPAIHTADAAMKLGCKFSFGEVLAEDVLFCCGFHFFAPIEKGRARRPC
jgi:hypothetical protein